MISSPSRSRPSGVSSGLSSSPSNTNLHLLPAGMCPCSSRQGHARQEVQEPGQERPPEVAAGAQA